MTRLVAGAQAPDFVLPVFPSGTFRLSKDASAQKIWLVLLRFAGCPFCNLHVHRMITRFADLKAAGVMPLAVFAAPLEDVAEHAGKQTPPFPLLADKDLAVHRLYGANSSVLGALDPRNFSAMLEARSLPALGGPTRGAVTLMPADFLLDGGKVVEASYGKRASQHLSFEHVLAWASGSATRNDLKGRTSA